MPSGIRQKIVYVPIDSLIPATYNPRKYSQKQLENLMESIRRYGCVDPIILNSLPERKNVIVGWHFRIAAIKALGIKEVPVLYLSLSLEREQELNLRLNENQWEWNYDLLKDFDIGLLLDIGFDNSELSHIWDSMLSVDDDDFQFKEELWQLGEPQSKMGDIYALGRHRLMCWDSTSSETVAELVNSLPEASWNISMIHLDPPYNIGVDYSRWLSNRKHYGGNKTNDNKKPEIYKEFLVKAFSNALQHAHQNTHVFCWGDPNFIWGLQSIYRELGIEPKRVCIWVKNSITATPQSPFNRWYEPCVYGARWSPYISSDLRNITEILNKEVGVGNRALEDIIDLFDLWLVKRLSSNQYEHPTQKPPSLCEKPLKRCTRVGDIVLDLFWGSWSTLVACEQLKRTALLMEYEPLFIDLIIKNYETLTNNKAIKIKGN